MKNDIDAVRKKLLQNAEHFARSFSPLRLGLVLYRDYPDEYITKVIPFTSDLAVFQKSLNAVRATGGKDIPEAVNEALYDSVLLFPWDKTAAKVVILIGDAPPHPVPLGNITEDMVFEAAKSAGVKINAVILPQ